MSKKQGRALIIGSSIAGLLAGRALADYFSEVILLDKERLDGSGEPRKAVPQGHHVHVILTPTYRALEQLLPEVIEDLVTHGAILYDGGAEVRFHIFGTYLIDGRTGRPVIGATRPFFEHHVRHHVGAYPGIQMRAEHRFARWLTNEAGTRIEGAAMQGPDGEVELGADLLIDARGRGSRLLKELQTLGFEVPFEETVGIGMGYTTRLFRAPGFDPGFKLAIANPHAPDNKRGGILARVENDQWVVTMFGYFGEHAAPDEAGFMDYAQKLSAPDIAEFLTRAVPVGEFQTFGTPQARMLRFEKLAKFPERLLAIGDTVCNLNPIYGQGMTKAAKEAMHLQSALGKHLQATSALDGFATRFRRTLPNVGADWAWQLTAGADLAYNEATGRRQLIDAFMGRYMRRLFLRAAKSLDTRRGVFDATMLVEPPSSLLRPRMILHSLGF